MRFVARPIAGAVWAAMLWLMRRRWVKRARRTSVRMLPAPWRDRARANLSRQDRFALRVGRRWLELAFGLLAYSVLITAMYLAVLRLYEAGALSVPERAPGR